MPRGYDAPLDLLDGLRRWNVSVSEVADESAAMVALAKQSVSSLIIVEPAMHQDAARLAAAVQRYHPGVKLWQYSWTTEPRLTQFGAPTIKSSETNAAAAVLHDRHVAFQSPGSATVTGADETTEAPAQAAEHPPMSEHVTPPVPRASGLIMEPPPPSVAEPADELEVLPPDDSERINTAAMGPVTLSHEEISMLLDETPRRKARKR